MKSKRSCNNNRAYIIAVILFLSLLNLFLPINGFAASFDSRDSLILLGNENLVPVVYNDNGEAKGVAVDIAKAIGDRIGIDVKVLALNWEEAQTMVLNGEAD